MTSLPAPPPVADDGVGGGRVDAAAVRALGDAVIRNVASVVTGNDAALRVALTVLLAEGHLLIEDVPGIGKTMLAKGLARSVGSTVSRIQFTPDLLPSDVTGVSVFDQVARRFEFKPGSVFANLVIGDEINRASPKTQSALLECMEERQVTVDGETYLLPRPFVVIATQNPVEMEGTYALPEAQRDRFMARIALGYPDVDAEVAMLDAHDVAEPLDALEPVVSDDALGSVLEFVRRVHVSSAAKRYAVDLARATREHEELRLGASPRATLQLVRAAKALAALEGRDFVLPDDLAALAVPVLAHRLVPTSRALGRSGEYSAVAEDVVRGVLETTPVPVGGAGRR